MTSEEITVTNIQKFGWTNINVFGDEELQQYSYTIGLYKNYGHPEVAISGIKGEIASQFLNIIGENIKNGRIYLTKGQQYDDIANDYNCEFKEINSRMNGYFFGRADWFYGNTLYTALQCVYPDKLGRMPWHEGYSMTVQDLMYRF